MRMLLCAAVAMGSALLAAGSADAATRDWPARGFDRVDLRAAAEVTIKTGAAFSVHADGDPSAIEQLTATVDKGKLTIGRQDHGSYSSKGPLRVTVTMPRLVGAGISGAGTMTVDHVEAPIFTADVGGAGTIRIPSLRADRTLLTMGGTGEIIVAGTTGQLDARVSGVGSIDAANLAARAGDVGMSGTGQVRARIDGPANVTLSGLGHVDIGGHPRCTVHKSGLGSVRCG